VSLAPSPPAPRAFTVRVGPHELLVPAERAWAFPGGRYYELNVTSWLERMLDAHRDAVLYDVGSNIGFYPVRLAERARQVYAFEPVAATFAVLDDNVRRNGLANVRALRLGVADAKGTAEINLWSSSGASSLYDQDLGLQPLGRETIELVALDELVASEGLLAPSVMKIDIEGAELPAVRGARRLLSRHRPDLVLECQEASCAAAGYSPAELVAELEGLGYRCFWLAQDHVDMRLHPFAHPTVAVQDLVAFAPDSPVPAAALAAEAGEPLRGEIVVVTLDELLGDPGLLRDYAARTAPDADRTLVIWAPEQPARVQDRLVGLVAGLGLDGEDAPDMLALTAGADRVGALLGLAATPLAEALA